MLTGLLRRRLRPSVSGSAGVLLIAAAIAGCGGSDGDSDSGSAASNADAKPKQSKLTEPIVIGGAIAKTGGMSIFDNPAWSMFKLAVADINAKGGVLGQPIKLVEANSGSTLGGAKSAAQNVIGKGAGIVMVTCNFDMAAPAANEAQSQNKISFTLCAASPKFGVKGIGPLAFSAGFPSQNEGAIGAKFAFEEGWKNGFLLEDTTIDYGQEVADGFAEAFPKLGGKLVGHDTFKNDDASIASQITKIKGSGADVLYLSSYNPGAASALRQIRAAGIDLPIVSNIGIDGTYWTKAVPNVSDFYSTGAVPLTGDDPNAQVNEVVARYAKTTGAPLASSLGVTGYVDAQVLAGGIDAAGSSDPVEIAKALESGKAFPTLVGPIKYSAELHIPTDRPMAVSKYTNGKPKLARYVTPPTGVSLGLGG